MQRRTNRQSPPLTSLSVDTLLSVLCFSHAAGIVKPGESEKLMLLLMFRLSMLFRMI